MKIFKIDIDFNSKWIPLLTSFNNSKGLLKFANVEPKRKRINLSGTSSP